MYTLMDVARYVQLMSQQDKKNYNESDVVAMLELSGDGAEAATRELLDVTAASPRIRAGMILGMDLAMTLLADTFAKPGVTVEELKLTTAYLSVMLMTLIANANLTSLILTEGKATADYQAMADQIKEGIEEMKRAVPVPQKEDWE